MTEITQAHSKLGASSMSRWSKCAGSVRLIESSPPAPTSSYALEGTRAHEAAALLLTGQQIPKTLMQHITDDDLQAVNIYVLYVRNLWETITGPTIKDRDKPAHKIFIEKKFNLESIHPGLFGTADCAIYNAITKTLHVIDYKHGRGIPVSPKDNPQLMYYALGAYCELNLKVDFITMTIVQPRYEGEDSIKSSTVKREVLLEFANDLITYAKATEQPDAPINPGDHCQFCAAKVLCPALQTRAQALAKSDFASADQEVAKWSPEQLGQFLKSVPVIEAWIKGVDQLCYSLAEQGMKIPGFKLVAKRATRKWNDVEEAQKVLSSRIAPNALRECMTRPELKSPAQVEKILGKAAKEILEEQCSAVSSGNVLVAEEDKRPEVLKDAKADFEAADAQLEILE